MSCLNASASGLELINYHRRLKGWTKQSAMWTSEAQVSEATLKRFWRQRKIRHSLFVAIVKSVGINDWETVAELSIPKIQPFFQPSDPSVAALYQRPEMPQYYQLIEARIQGCNIMYSDRILNQLQADRSPNSGAGCCMV